MAYSVVGREHYIVTEPNLQSTTSLVYVPYLSLTTSVLRGGKYRISWFTSIVRSISVIAYVHLQVLLDTTTTLFESNAANVFDFGTEYNVKEAMLSAGVHTLEINYKKSFDTPAYNAEILRGHIEIWRTN